jgi:acetolactate decarboxylase
MKTLLMGCMVLCSATALAGNPWNLKVYGALKRIMHEGDVSEKVSLADVVGRPGLYGLGPATDLKGELIVLGGKAYLGKVAGDAVSVIDAGEESAAMLVTAEVMTWREVALDEDIASLAALDNYLADHARRLGVPADQPFPFMLRARPTSAQWHVIDWPEGDKEHTHAKHQTAGKRGDLKGEPATFLGFFSDRHQGVFTHRNSRIHVHLMTDDGTLVAHVDGLSLAGATLLLPRIP